MLKQTDGARACFNSFKSGFSTQPLCRETGWEGSARTAGRRFAVANTTNQAGTQQFGLRPMIGGF
jgi:hypothetical protein